MFTLPFWKDAAERAIKTAAQATLALFTTNMTGILEVDPVQTFSVAALAAVVSVLTSVVSSKVGDDDSASVVNQ
ncbi:MAG TPA: holin [Actinobacteria bacterium]|nr:holin [Actinomycetota bacterium]